MVGAESLFATEFQISIMLFVAFMGYFITTRIGQNIVITEILLGVLIGPTILGLVTYTDIIGVLAQFGAIFLLFAIGMEMRFKEIYNMRSFLIALFGVVVPWIGGFAIASAFNYDFISSVFVGTALTATSIAITANVLREMKVLDSRAAKTIIGAAVVDDILGLLALSLTTELAANAISMPGIATKVGIAVVFLAVGGFTGGYISKAFLKMDAVARKKGTSEMIFILAVAIAFLYSAIAEFIGLSAVVGAFIAGVSLENVKLPAFREGARYLEIVFAAIFFVSVGILFDLEIAALQAIMPFIIVVTVIAFTTKLVGCGIGARACRTGGRESMVIGLGMAPRGEVAIIVALIGLNAGVIGQEIYSTVVVMALLTTIFTPPLLKRAFGWYQKEQRIVYRRGGWAEKARKLAKSIPGR
ncbi:MAG: cation:proton antiporter [Candidatus Aenigmarchaeota archaeon]|nr:cation:proton antiporter [Candidatus Aenigmarchaeota archaeon]